jgi:uncharacterized membrane protein YfcA
MESHTAAIIGILFVASLTASTFGFGVGLIAMPILAVIVDIKTASPLVGLVITTVIVTILLRQWREVQFKSVWRLIIASFLGVPVGLFLLKGAHDHVMKLVLAVIIIAFSFYNLFTPHLLTLKTERSSYLFGGLAGILGGAYTIPGPPIIIYGILRQWPPSSFRVTLLGCFLPSTILVIFGHYSAGLWTSTVLQLYACSFPAVLLAIVIGNRINRSLPKGKFDSVIYGLLIVIGLLLSMQALQAMLSIS